MRTDQGAVVMLDDAASKKNTNTCCVVSSSSSDPFLSSSENGVTTTNTSTQKRKRRPAGTPGNNKSPLQKFIFYSFNFYYYQTCDQFQLIVIVLFPWFSLKPIKNHTSFLLNFHQRHVFDVLGLQVSHFFFLETYFKFMCIIGFPLFSLQPHQKSQLKKKKKKNLNFIDVHENQRHVF